MHINIPKYLPHCSVVISVIWLEDGWHGQNSEGTPRCMARPLKAYLGWELAHCHFYHILLAKASYKTSPDQGEGK